ncbi:hypothetical protein PV325_013008, partial [Microctonus aethiopoides]
VQQDLAKSQAAAIFCKTFNDISDMFNCKNKFAKGTMNVPLNDASIDKLKNAANKFEEYINCLQTKLSQDYLETFFCAIRSRGGFNNNPNAFQSRSAYKRLVIRHELREFEN